MPDTVRDALLRARTAINDAVALTDTTPVPEPPPPGGTPPAGRLPSDVLPAIKTWTLMLPTGSQGDPDNIYPTAAVPDVFYVQDDGGVAFVADVVNGVHSPNSKYVRTELRQMANADWKKAAWSSSGSHSLTASLAIDTSNLTARKRCNGLQIHDGGDDVCQIMKHEANGLGFMYKDGQAWVPIDPVYRDGTKFTCKILAEKDRIKVWYNNTLKVDVPVKGTGWYWKAGCYSQTGGASEYKEPAGATAKVVIYELATTGGAT